MKNTSPKIIYVGSSKSFQRELSSLLTEFNKSHPHEIIPLDSFDLSLSKVIPLEPKAIILDLNEDNERYDLFLKEFNLSCYPKKTLITGVATEISDHLRERCHELNIHMLFSKITGASDEPRFMIESILGYIYPSSLIKRHFAMAKPAIYTKIEIPVWVKKITFSELTVNSNFKPHDKQLLALKHDYFRRLAWRETNISILKTIPSHTSIHNYETSYKTEVIKQEELDRFEADFHNKTPQANDAAKKESMIKFLKPLAIEKKQNLMNFYRKNRFDCDKQNKKPFLIISKNMLDYKLRSEELVDNFTVYKTHQINNHLSLIKKFKPQTIFFELEPHLAGESNEIFLKNNLETLSFLFFKIQEMKLNIPLIVFNNNAYPPEDVASCLGLKNAYQEIIAPCSAAFIDGVLKEQVSKEKVQETKSQLNFQAQSMPEPVLYPPEREAAQLGFAEIPIKIESISEQEVLIECNAELSEYLMMKVFHATGDFFITILPNERNYIGNTGMLRRYIAQISGLNSEQRDALRGYVITFNKNKNVA